jgi:hypothetical protein
MAIIRLRLVTMQTNLAINTTRTKQDVSDHVVVSQTYDGNLKLRAFRASRVIDTPQLDLITEKTVNFPPPVSLPKTRSGQLSGERQRFDSSLPPLSFIQRR